MSKRNAIIIGHEGQDGRLLTRLLLQRGYDLLGIGRSTLDHWGAMAYREEFRLDCSNSVCDLVRSLQPQELYYLAAHHASSQARQSEDLHEDYQLSLGVNVTGVLHFLEAIRCHSPQSRFFFASSSLIYGNRPQQSPQDETTQVAPEEPYGLCKALSGQMCRDYRARHRLFASVGILFNHESCLRPSQYLSTKIISAAVAASRGEIKPLVVGSLDAIVDWGYAPDYVDAFTRILALEAPGDFVVASGVAHTVRDFAATAFARVGLDWSKYVLQDPAVLTRSRSGRVGDPSKLRRITGWCPSLTFKEMVALLIDQALEDLPSSTFRGSLPKTGG